MQVGALPLRLLERRLQLSELLVALLPQRDHLSVQLVVFFDNSFILLLQWFVLTTNVNLNFALT